MARTLSVIFDFDFDEIVNEMDSWRLRGEKGIDIHYGSFNLGRSGRKVSQVPLDEEMYGMRKYSLGPLVCMMHAYEGATYRFGCARTKTWI